MTGAPGWAVSRRATSKRPGKCPEATVVVDDQNRSGGLHRLSVTPHRAPGISPAGRRRRQRHGAAIERARMRRISAANYLETAVVIDGSRDPVASRRFDELIAAAELRVEPVTGEQAQIARAAYRDFGKGSGHKAGLNFGDCFAYAQVAIHFAARPVSPLMLRFAPEPLS